MVAFSVQSALPLPDSACFSSVSELPRSSPSQCGSPIGNSRVNSGESSRVDSAVKSSDATFNVGSQVPVLLAVSFRDVLAPPSPRSAKKNFEDVLNSIEEMPEPTCWMVNRVYDFRPR